MTGRSVVLPGILLGIGLGGAFDLILFHQILQWHHVASGRVPADTVSGLQFNVLADGLFFALMWVVTVAGLVLLWRATAGLFERPPARVVLGAVVVGWGGFNVYDAIVDHYVLGLHHTTHGPDAVFWDIVILAWGAAFVVAGTLLVRGARRAEGVTSGLAAGPTASEGRAE